MVDKKKIEIIAIPILLIIFIIYLGDMLKKIGGARKALAPGLKAASKELKIDAGEMKAQLKMKTTPDVFSWGRDPFVLYETATQTASTIESLHLMGITWSSDAKTYSAIINDELVAAGSTIGAFTVMEIKKEKVIVKDEKQSYELKLERR